MKRTKLGILAPAPALAAAGVIVATVGVSDPGSTLAVPILASLGIFATLAIARLHRDPEQARFLRDLMLLAVAVRLFVFALIHQSVGPYVFAPDQFTYESWGSALLRVVFEDAPMPRALSGTLQVGYASVNAALYLVFGEAKAAAAILNVYLSSWTAVPVYHVALALVRRHQGVAKWAAGLTVFFPSLILWSVLNIREAPTILIVTVILYFFVKVQQEADVQAVAGVIIGLGVLTLFREYLTSLVGVAGTAGILMGRSRSPVRSLVAGSVILFVLTYVAQNLGVGGSLAGEPTLERAQLIRQGMAFGAGSAYGTGADITTPTGAITFLPIGLAYFLLAPFPWDITSALQAITLPETLLWYALIPVGIRGAWLALKHDPRSHTIPVAVFIVVTFAYALVEGNVGTAYRHRAQVLPIAFLFCAVGAQQIYATWHAKRLAGAQRRQRARTPGTRVGGDFSQVSRPAQR